MKCQAVLDRLSQCLEQDLPSTELEAVTQHLSQCASCRAEAESLRAAEQALQTLSALEPAPDLLADLRRRLAVSPVQRPRWAWAGLAAAVAVAALLIWLRPETKSGTTLTPRPSAPRKEVRRPVPPMVAAAAVPAAEPAPVHRPKLSAKQTTSHPRPAKAVTPRPTEKPAPSLPSEAAPVQAAHAPDGIILVLGEPEPVLRSSECHLEVRLEDGTTNVLTQSLKRDEAGRLRTATVSYQTLPPTSPSPSQGG